MQGSGASHLLLAAVDHRQLPAHLHALGTGRPAVHAARLHEDVRDVRGRSVVDHARVGRRAACAALVVDDDPVMRRVEKAPVAGGGASTRAAVEEQHLTAQASLGREGEARRRPRVRQRRPGWQRPQLSGRHRGGVRRHPRRPRARRASTRSRFTAADHGCGPGSRAGS